jgi:hypothetical protein
MDNRTFTDTANDNSLFSMGRMIARRVSEQPIKKPFYQTYSDQSQRMSALSARAIGQTIHKINYSDGSSFIQKGISYGNPSLVRHALNRVRNQGAVPPKKKGAIANPYRSGGRSLIGGSFNQASPVGPTGLWVY